MSFGLGPRADRGESGLSSGRDDCYQNTGKSNLQVQDLRARDYC